MPLFSFFNRAALADHARQISFKGYRPELRLHDLVLGVDNLRHDVFLSQRFTEITRAHIALLVCHHGGVHELLDLENAEPRRRLLRPGYAPPQRPAESTAEFKKKASDLETASLARARRDGNISLDLLLRIALVKFLRAELQSQYTQAAERCRSKLRALDRPGMMGMVGMRSRELFAKFQLNKRAVLRQAGEDLYEALYDVERETIAPMRRSLFGESESATYELFLNRLLFSEDGRDDFLKARHYVMLGNYDRDPDRLAVLRELAHGFLRGVLPAASAAEDEDLDDLLNVPENAQEMTGGGTPEDSAEKGNAQRQILSAWMEALESAGILDYVVAAYEAVPLLGEYSALINPQQLKNALVARAERTHVEELLAAQGKLSAANFQAAVRKLAAYGRAERTRFAGRFMVDLFRYHRDLRRLEALNAAVDQVNLISSERMRQLSSINSTLYEFTLPEEYRPGEARVSAHVILKADVRDSTRLTQTLLQRGQNPASYFSLGFYEPVGKLLPKYGATKVFIEGDAIILAIEERPGMPGFVVGRTCALASEMIAIVHNFYRQSQSLGLPPVELGLGISFQDSAPMYLLDGTSRIMISDALNRADRLSACHRRARKHLAERKPPFHVFRFQPSDDAGLGLADDGPIQYNVGGIQIEAVAFQHLQQEIALQRFEMMLPGLWGEEVVTFYHGLVPVTAEIFQPLVIREAPMPVVDARSFSFREWTNTKYYELCISEAIITLVERARQRATTT